jgi:DNA-binding CsgD family transcriptional regulator
VLNSARVTIDHGDDRGLETAQGTPHLEIEAGPMPRGKKILRLKEGTSVIGRGLGVTFLFDAEGVSRRHAKLTYGEDGAVTLYDLGSTNGTLVNQRKAEITPLRDGDLIEIGTLRLRFGRGDPRYRQSEGPVGAGLNPIDKLSEREREIAQEVALGLTNAEIASKLHLSARTVGTHLANIYARVGAKNRVGLTREVMAWNLQATEIKD